MSTEFTYEIYVFFRNLLITSAVIMPVLLIFFALERHERKLEKYTSSALPETYQQILTNIRNFQEVSVSVRLFHCIKTFLYGLFIYILIMTLGAISLTFHKQFTSFADLFVSSFPFLVVIIFFIIFNWIKVGPWYRIYRTKAYISSPSGLDHMMRYVVIYDHKNQEYSTGRVHFYELFLARAHKDCNIVDIILCETPKRMKVVGVYHEHK